MAEKSRLHYLDTVRGFAAISVLWSHFAFGFGMPKSIQNYTNTPFHMFWDGLAGVSIFFVLSGLVLSLKYLNYSQDRQSSVSIRIVPFYITRFCRISIPFIFVLLITIFCFHSFYKTYNTDPHATSWLYGLWKDNPASLLSVLKQAALIMPLTQHTYVPQAWTLTLEMQVSILMPFFILLAKKNMLFLTIPCLIIIVFDFMNTELTQISISIMCLFHFYLGILIARYFNRFKQFVLNMNLLLKIVLLITGLLFYSFRFSVFVKFPEILSIHKISYMNAIGAFLLLLFCIGTKSWQKFLNIRALNFLGKISYSLYLCHLLILIALVPPCIQFLNLHNISPNIVHYLTLFMSTFISVFVSLVLYYLVEKPSIKLGKSLSMYFSSKITPIKRSDKLCPVD